MGQKKKTPKIKQERTSEDHVFYKDIITEDGRTIRGDGIQLDYLLPKQTFHSMWDSPEAFAKYIDSICPKDAWNRAGWEEDKQFHGTENMAEAIKLAREGWQEGAEKIEKLRGMIKAMYPKHPKLISYGLAGATPNVPRAVAGNLFNMRVPDPARSKKKPTITLVANMSANCMIDANMISNRSAVLAAVIDEVESAGYSCEVLATAMSKGRSWDEESKGFKAATTIIVKPSHQPVDIKRLAFSLGHASLFRRLIFADWGIEETCKGGLGYGLGNAGGGFKEEQEEMLEKSIFMLPSAETKSEYFKNDDTAMTKGLPYLIQHLKELGCPPFKHTPNWKDPDKEEDSDQPEPYPDDEDDDD